jgi:hypothetical protein
MKIIDAFIALDELDMIQCRMAELADWSPVHIALEAAWTHQGNPNEFKIGPANIEGLFVYQVNETVPRDSQFAVERFYRDLLMNAIREFANPQPDDLVLICDVDEIIRGSAIPKIAEATTSGPHALDLRLHRYSSEWVEMERWDHNAFAARWQDLVSSPSLSRLRNRPSKSTRLPVVSDSGWHLSYWGGVERFQRKLDTFAHDELKHLIPKANNLVNNGINVHGSMMLPWDGSDMPKGLK